MFLFFFDQTVDILHVAAGDRDAAQTTLPVKRDVPAPSVRINIARTVDHDATAIGLAVGSFQPSQSQTAPIPSSPIPGHLESAERRAFAARYVAEYRSLVRAASPGSMHRVTRVDYPSFVKGPYEQPRLSAWNGIVEQDAVVLVHPSPTGI